MNRETLDHALTICDLLAKDLNRLADGADKATVGLLADCSEHRLQIANRLSFIVVPHVPASEKPLPHSEFFASLNPGLNIKTLDDYFDAEEPAPAKPPQRRDYGTLPALPREPKNSPAALSERRKAIERADMARNIGGIVLVVILFAAAAYLIWGAAK